MRTVWVNNFAQSDPGGYFNQRLLSALFPSITYHYNSGASYICCVCLYSRLLGGDPLTIPSLSYEELKDFHRTHYHPKNARYVNVCCGGTNEPSARFFTYGDLPLGLALEHVNTTLKEWIAERNIPLSVPSIPSEKRYTKPIEIEEIGPPTRTIHSTHLCGR